MRIRVLRDRMFTPPGQRRITVAYKTGQELTVKREWGDALVEDGDAVEVDTPAREDVAKPRGRGR